MSDFYREQHKLRLAYMPWLYPRLKPRHRDWAAPWQAELQRQWSVLETVHFGVHCFVAPQARLFAEPGRDIHVGDGSHLKVGAASKGIIQRDFQHNATVYKSPYAKNPFDMVSNEELEEYKRIINNKGARESGALSPTSPTLETDTMGDTTDAGKTAAESGRSVITIAPSPPSLRTPAITVTSSLLLTSH